MGLGCFAGLLEVVWCRFIVGFVNSVVFSLFLLLF